MKVTQIYLGDFFWGMSPQPHCPMPGRAFRCIPGTLARAGGCRCNRSRVVAHIGKEPCQAFKPCQGYIGKDVTQKFKFEKSRDNSAIKPSLARKLLKEKEQISRCKISFARFQQ